MIGTDESRNRTGPHGGSPGSDRRPRLLKLVATVTSVLGATILIAACGGSSNSTSYWRANLTGGGTLYMSVVVNSQGVSGYAKYEDGSWQPYTGTVSSDGTYAASAYTGVTLDVSGSTMTMTYDDGAGTWHWAQATASLYKGGGGPSVGSSS